MGGYIGKSSVGLILVVCVCIGGLYLPNSAPEKHDPVTVTPVTPVTITKVERAVKRTDQEVKNQVNVTHIGYAVGATLFCSGFLGYYLNHSEKHAEIGAQNSPSLPGIVPSHRFSDLSLEQTNVRPLVVAPFCRIRPPFFQRTRSAPMLSYHTPHYVPLFSPVHVEELRKIPDINSNTANQINDLFKAISSGDKHSYTQSESIENGLISLQNSFQQIDFQMKINDQIFNLNCLRYPTEKKLIKQAIKLVNQINSGRLVLETDATLFTWEKVFENKTKLKQDNDKKMKPTSDDVHDEFITWENVRLTNKKTNSTASLDHCIEIQRTGVQLSYEPLLGGFSGEHAEVTYTITGIKNLISVLQLITKKP